MAERFQGQVALVTGGSSGIGRAAAVAFAAEGARVVVAARGEVESEETVQLIRDAGGEAIAVRTDVAVASDVESLVGRTVEAYGGLDRRGLEPDHQYQPQGCMVVHEVPDPANAQSRRRNDR